MYGHQSTRMGGNRLWLRVRSELRAWCSQGKSLISVRHSEPLVSLSHCVAIMRCTYEVWDWPQHGDDMDVAGVLVYQTCGVAQCQRASTECRE